MNRERIFQVADSQNGYFTSKQAEESGYARANFHRFVRSGEWVKEHRGIYRLSMYPIQDRPELVLWTLWSRNKKGEFLGVWSHQTALDIHELTDIMPAKMHMTVPKEFRKNQQIPEILTLHYAHLSEDEVEKRRGYKVTTPIRTFADIISAESVSIDQITMGIKDALRRGLFSKHQITRNQTVYPQLMRFYKENIDENTI